MLLTKRGLLAGMPTQTHQTSNCQMDFCHSATQAMCCSWICAIPDSLLVHVRWILMQQQSCSLSVLVMFDNAFCGVVSIVVDHVQCYDAINGQFTHCSIVIAREYLPLPDFCGMIFTTPGLHTSCVLFLLTSFSLIILLGLLIPMASMHAEWSSLLRSSCRDKTNC